MTPPDDHLEAVGRTLIIILLTVLFVAYAKHTWAHEWYSGLKSPKTGVSCCNDRDCAPTDGCILDDGTMGIIAQQGCIPINWELVLDQPSPDGRLHLCQIPQYGQAPGRVLCVIMGGGV